MKDKLILTKYKISIFGFSGSLTFAFLCVLLYLIGDGELIFLYIPGAIFGLTMTLGLKKHLEHSSLLFILSTVMYLMLIFFCSKDFEYLVLRRIFMGGLGALLFLYSVNLTTYIKLKISDYILGFCIGILTTFFMWTDNFENINIPLTIISIILWQTLIATIINSRILIWSKTSSINKAAGS